MMKEGQNRMRQIIHLDMDAFFAAIEQHDNPDYRGKPVIVGGDPRSRGVVSTCSYEARKFGVRSAMPLREAARLCPHGIFVPGRMRRYQEVSEQVMAILREYTPLVEQISIDEAFMDVTGCQALFGPAEAIARNVVDRIRQNLGLSASVGIAPNKFLAKLASDLQKPAGFVVLTPENFQTVLDPLPVKRLWGVGPQTEKELLRMGIETISQLRRLPVDYLCKNLGELGRQLYQLANGIDGRPVMPPEEAKSVGHEVTFQEDNSDEEFLASVLLALADRVARRLRQAGLKGRTVTVKIRNADFKTITRSRTLIVPTDFEEEIYQNALELAEEAKWGHGPVRLLGVSISNFTGEEGAQLTLFPETNRSELAELHRAVDRLRDRFGEGIITRGSLIKRDGRRRG